MTIDLLPLFANPRSIVSDIHTPFILYSPTSPRGPSAAGMIRELLLCCCGLRAPDLGRAGSSWVGMARTGVLPGVVFSVVVFVVLTVGGLYTVLHPLKQPRTMGTGGTACSWRIITPPQRMRC